MFIVMFKFKTRRLCIFPLIVARRGKSKCLPLTQYLTRNTLARFFTERVKTIRSTCRFSKNTNSSRDDFYQSFEGTRSTGHLCKSQGPITLLLNVKDLQ